MNWRDLLKVTGLPIVFASLCCLAPLVLVLLGLSSVAFGASLADNLYGNYRWAFRGIGLLLLIISLVIYFRKKGICTLDQVKRERRMIINVILLALLVFVVGYIIFLYVIVEIIGIPLGLWENPIPKILEVLGM
jgi:hypothetical protein